MITRLLLFIFGVAFNLQEWGTTYDVVSDVSSYKDIEIEVQNHYYDDTSNLCYSGRQCINNYSLKKTQVGPFFAFIGFSNATKGVGGNGAASELGNLSGKSASEISNVLKNAGFSGKSISPSSYQRFVHKDGSVIWVNWKSGRITRHPSPKYGADGSRINRGQRLDSNGAEVPKNTPHNQIQENFKP